MCRHAQPKHKQSIEDSSIVARDKVHVLCRFDGTVYCRNPNQSRKNRNREKRVSEVEEDVKALKQVNYHISAHVEADERHDEVVEEDKLEEGGCRYFVLEDHRVDDVTTGAQTDKENHLKREVTDGGPSRQDRKSTR